MEQLNLFGKVAEISNEEIKDEKDTVIRLLKLAEDNEETELPNQNNQAPPPIKTFIKADLAEPHGTDMNGRQNPESANQLTQDEYKTTSKSAIKKVDIKALKPKKENPQAGKKEPQKRGRKSLKEGNVSSGDLNIPSDEVLSQKQYYPLSVVAKWFNVTPSVLRYWEKEFAILKPRTNSKGDRRFRPEDVKNLQLIYHLIREKKYTMEGAREYMSAHTGRENSQLFFIRTLEKFKSFLIDLKTNLQA